MPPLFILFLERFHSILKTGVQAWFSKLMFIMLTGNLLTVYAKQKSIPVRLIQIFLFGCSKRLKISRLTHKNNISEAYSCKLFPLSHGKEQD